MDPEAAAEQLLETAWYPERLFDPFPVNPISIATKLGIKVFDANLPNDVSGLLVRHPAQDPEIHLQQADSPNRRRFTCAHELGHYVSRIRDSRDEEWGYVDKRSPLTAEGIAPDEIFANKFAAALLMPREAVMKMAKENQNAVTMALGFGVSEDAMSFRLENLRVAR